MKKTLYFLFSFIILSSNTFSQVNLNDGLVGYFPFNGNTSDNSILNIDGIENNVTLTSDINSNINSAYLFNGINSSIDCSSNQRGIDDTLTVSLWFKTSTSNYNWLIGKYDWTIDKGFILAIDNGKVYVAGRNNNGSYNSAISTSFINDNNWHHVMGIIYNNTWELWLDCVLEDVTYTNSTNPSLVNSTNLTMGNYYIGEASGEHHYYTGSMDEVRLYNRLLTNDEKTTLCNNTVSIESFSDEIPQINIYPNPAKNFIKIESNIKSFDKIELFNSLGTNTKVKLDENKIDVSNLCPGIYFIKLYNGTSLTTKKFIVE